MLSLSQSVSLSLPLAYTKHTHTRNTKKKMSHLQLPIPIENGILHNKIRELYDNVILTSYKLQQQQQRRIYVPE